MHQTDIQPVANALDDLVSSLRLNSSYTMFLMNPKVLSDPITMETLQFFGKDSVLCVCAFVSVCVFGYMFACVFARGRPGLRPFKSQAAPGLECDPALLHS